MTMTLEEMKNHKWSVSWSGGKDSTATVILMHENNVPIEEIVYVRMMYDETLPATLPIMTNFVDNAIKTFEEWGYKIRVVKSIRTAKELAEQTYFRQIDKKGKPYGIIQFGRGKCKFTGIKVKTIENIALSEYQMIGYAVDEVDRIQRLTDTKQSIMVTMNVKEIETFDICRKYNLLSPLYDLGIKRDGCFFCPNCAKRERELIKKDFPELIEKIDYMVELSTKSYNVSENFPNNWVKDYYDRKALEKQVTFDDLMKEGWIE